MIIKQMLTTEENIFSNLRQAWTPQKLLYYQLMRSSIYAFEPWKNFVPKNTDIKGRMRINAMMHILAKVTAQNLF